MAEPETPSPGNPCPTQTAELVARAQRGEVGARDELLEALRPALCDRIDMMMGSAARRYAEGHDIVHGALLEVVRDLGRFTPKSSGSLLRWACQIARNRIHDELRRKHELAFESLTSDSWNLAGGVASGPSPSSVLDLNERKERLADAMVELSSSHRDVIRLRYFEGLRFAAIGERMGRSENAVMLLHTRALLRLGAMLRSLDEPMDLPRTVG